MSPTPTRSSVIHTKRVNQHHRAGYRAHSAAGRADRPSLDKKPGGQRGRTKLYMGVGSNSNITENGIGAEIDRASIWEVDRATGAHRIFASGLRNPNGLSWEPHSHALWAVVNERDELGPNLVPDYMTSVKDGAFYGWPWSYYGQHVDLGWSLSDPTW